MRALLLSVIVIACSRDKSSPPPTSTASAASAASAAPAAEAPAAAPACSLSPIALKRPAAKRVIAIGDLHGDLAATRSALKTAGVIDDKDAWIGKDTVVVQTGDVLDRGEDEQAILDLLFKLEG